MTKTLIAEKRKAREQQIEQEIEDVNRTIDGWEDIDPLFMHKPIRDLRHRVMFVHARLETSLGILLGRYVMKPAKKIIPKETSQIMMTKFHWIISDMEFARKVNVAEDFGLISGPVKSNLFAVNNLRLAFSHLVSHETELLEFLDNNNYLKALKKLVKAYEVMNDIFKSIEQVEKKSS